ncbi:PD-(D/E)XK nuclease-like domain-containing protein [Fibrella sp. HMF5405]|uniref:PD-(D/E)XK nuclease-like domain-containing protein n=2 Tax=Fibrella forsythiae TaxID=2817061 RepID=A0ABS3JRK8_9BACT|nr:PD-(D/E)XK nuclease-like domain-containing protein [Fibrella forsythiae]
MASSPGRVLTTRDAGLDYRELPRISNSDLTRIKEEQVGYQLAASRWATERTRSFGKAFHQHLLEPESVATVLEQLLPDLTNSRLTSSEQNKLDGLMDAVRHDAFCRRYLRMAERGRTGLEAAEAERERVVLFTDPTTKLACKSRLDLVYTSPKRQNTLIFDFKTTSARTQAQFLQSCYDYDYDRQAAFYLDSLRFADGHEWATTRRFRFVFVGVMKDKPHRLFAVDATSLPGFVDYGRKKYRFWLKKWQETNGLTD